MARSGVYGTPVAAAVLRLGKFSHDKQDAKMADGLNTLNLVVRL